MAVYAGPEVVTNGLVLAIDAGSAQSYPGSGTAWTDLSGNENNGTLTNGPTFNSTNGGSIIFDGVNDYADFFAPNLGTTTTVEMWCKIGSGYTNKMMFGWFDYDVFCGSGSLGYNTGNSGDLRGITSATVTALQLVNNWKHYIFEMRTDVSYANNKIYINTNSQTLSQSGTEGTWAKSFNSGNGRIAVWRKDINYCMPMNLASFRVYNRALSAAEIAQNFNALRGRFGI